MARSNKKISRPKPVVLLILEGWGVAPAHPGNAITEAAPAYFDYLLSHYPAVTVTTPRPATAEAGHAMIGLGRPYQSALELINSSITDNTFKTMPVLRQALAAARHGRLHILSLLSSVEAESSRSHLEALLSAAQAAHVENVYVHAILDGRDSAPTAGQELISDLERRVKAMGGRVASFSGRVYALDQTHHYERTEKYAAALSSAAGPKCRDAAAAIGDHYANKIFDEELPPTIVVDENDAAVGAIQPGDIVICTHMSGAAMRQLVTALSAVPAESPTLLSLVDYGIGAVKTIFSASIVKTTLGTMIAGAGLRQLRISDSEGFADVTCFLNGGACAAQPDEDRMLIPALVTEAESERSEEEIEALSKELLRAIEAKNHDVIIVTFSALDRIAHTADLPATIAAVQAIDAALKRIVSAVLSVGVVALGTASHGLAEVTMLPVTMDFAAHSDRPVPLLLIGSQFAGYSLRFPQPVGGDLSLLEPVGTLADVAPTIARLLRLNIPPEMTGRSLIDDNNAG